MDSSKSPRLRTFLYVDGFNLYNRALVRTRFKWLNLLRFAQRMLRPENDVQRIRYYTARVSGRRDPGQPMRQQVYLSALKTVPCVSIHFGSFLSKQIRRPLVDPPCACPCCTYVDVHTTEEKGSDVNLATHMIHDGMLDEFDVGVVLSKDTDLVEPIRILRCRGKTVGVICPDGQIPRGLAEVASFVRHVTSSDLAASQFPDELVIRPGRVLRRPAEWA